MWSAITGFIAIIKALIDLWKTWQQYQKQQRIVMAERKQQELEKAIEDAKKATTAEEAFNAQERIVNNQP